MLVPGLLVTVVAGLLVVKLAQHLQAAALITGGLLLNVVGYTLIAFTGQQGSDLGLIIAFMILGAGIGAAETISNDLILSSVPAEKAGSASAISETAYETGAVLGTRCWAVFSTWPTAITCRSRRVSRQSLRNQPGKPWAMPPRSPRRSAAPPAPSSWNLPTGL